MKPPKEVSQEEWLEHIISYSKITFTGSGDDVVYQKYYDKDVAYILYKPEKKFFIFERDDALGDYDIQGAVMTAQTCKGFVDFQPPLECQLSNFSGSLLFRVDVSGGHGQMYQYMHIRLALK